MKRLKILLPILVVVIGSLAAGVILLSPPKAEPQEHLTPAPLVRAVRVEQSDMLLIVRAQGVVAPRTEIEIVPEVSGTVVAVSPNLTDGGFFDKDEVLLRIDPRDYELAVRSAKAAVAQAQVALAREQAEAEVARGEWDSLKGGQAPALVLHEPQLAEAAAALEAAKAQLERARLDLERCSIRAPFRGRVRSKRIDRGQFLATGVAVAAIYGVDVAEVRLPLPDEELAYLDLPLGYSDQAADSEGPEVVLSAVFAGRRYTWPARIVRTEGELDPASRMVHAVAQVREPYAHGDDLQRPPLAVGMFVQAEISGRRVRGVFAVPRSAMRGPGRVLVVDTDDRLRFTDVEVLRFEPERVILRSGLVDGERVCVSPLELAVDGMKVRVADTEAGG